MTGKSPRQTGSRGTARKAAPSTSQKSTPEKLSLNSLAATIADLEKRMKQADSLTKRSVTNLKKIIKSLEDQTSNAGLAQKAELTGYVNRIAERLRGQISMAKADIQTDLGQALKNPEAGHVQELVQRAFLRLQAAEQTQADALSKINRHLASLATAMDARVKEETAKQNAALLDLSQKMETRIGTVESEVAKAVETIGVKVGELGDGYKSRDETAEAAIEARVEALIESKQSALAAEKENFETFKAGLESRLEELHASGRADISKLEHQFAAMGSRLEGLEFGISEAISSLEGRQQAGIGTAPIQSMDTHDMQAAPSQAEAPLTLIEPVAAEAEPAPAAYQDVEIPAGFAQMPIAMNVEPATQPTSEARPGEAIPYTPPTPAPAPTPVAAQTQQVAQAPAPQISVAEPEAKADPGAPVPYIPAAPAPVPVPATPPFAEFTDPAFTKPGPGTIPGIALPGSLAGDAAATTADSIPFAEPAYAETPVTRSRFGKSGSDGGDGSGGRKLRLMAIAASLAIIALLAGRTMLGGNNMSIGGDDPMITAVPNSEEPGTTQVALGVSETNIEAPIGQYEDNQATVPDTPEAASTLNAAAGGGDPISQFQLGLSYLEGGRTAEGIELIRKAADQNQPAAQYRLAKLYETGEGVPQNSEMARKLTERAATQGNRIAMHDLALYHAEGRGGLTANLKTAAKWFEKAAERGVVDSQFNLGVLFESGKGLPRNREDAYVWYAIASGQGDQTARKRVDFLTNILNEDELASAKSRVKRFRPTKIDNAANGIFRQAKDKQAAASDDTAATPDAQIAQVQKMLTALGYDAGGTDGSIGPKTRSAIIGFERDNSLPETGRINSDLVERLELASGA